MCVMDQITPRPAEYQALSGGGPFVAGAVPWGVRQHIYTRPGIYSLCSWQDRRAYFATQTPAILQPLGRGAPVCAACLARYRAQGWS